MQTVAIVKEAVATAVNIADETEQTSAMVLPVTTKPENVENIAVTVPKEPLSMGSMSTADAVAKLKLRQTIESTVQTGTQVSHKIFGIGIVSWMDQHKKYIRVKFAVGEKQFVFPDAFEHGYLSLI